MCGVGGGGIVNGLERGRQALLIDRKVCLGVWEGGIVNELERGRQALLIDWKVCLDVWEGGGGALLMDWNVGGKLSKLTSKCIIKKESFGLKQTL